MSQSQKYYKRFSVGQRIEHWLQVFAFTALAITGLPQKFVPAGWAEGMIAAMGGIENVRIYHRVAAVILLIGVIYHGGYITYQLFVKRAPLTMMPSWQDVKDFYSVLSYNLGLKGAWPKMPRYNFEEKAEYWAFVWGTVVMVITGFMLWNPIATARFLPGSFIPAGKAAHGGEALLAVLAIIVWHFYGVHLKKFNRSMFTGKLSRDEMKHEHALELEEIESDGRIESPPEEVAHRRRIFIPVGTVITLILLAGLYWFVTFEETAIPTVVAATNEGEAYQPLGIDAGGNIHTTIKSYEGPQTCANTGCHNGEVVTAANNSEHWQRIAAAGPNPVLAMTIADTIPSGGADSNCLICHAQEYDPDDPLASAHTIKASGGDDCQRCHADHSADKVHVDAGLACVSCHVSTGHEISADGLHCTNCHRETPHSDPLINNHTRLDCRTCHATGRTESLTVDTSQPVLNPATGFFEPTRETVEGTEQFMWYVDGEPADIDTTGAVIVPELPTTVLRPEDFDPIEFAETGSISGEVEEYSLDIVLSHGLSLEAVRTCDTCHGPEGDFDFSSLGYDEEQVDRLSMTDTTE